jgi:cation transport protein ChaC
VPTWIEGRTAAGGVRALTFTIDRHHQRYAGKLDEAAVVTALATAEGPIGRCCDYLFNTHEHLQELAIHDPQLARICRLVRAHPGVGDAVRSDP